jgi:hypothetical protein
MVAESRPGALERPGESRPVRSARRDGKIQHCLARVVIEEERA